MQEVTLGTDKQPLRGLLLFYFFIFYFYFSDACSVLHGDLTVVEKVRRMKVVAFSSPPSFSFPPDVKIFTSWSRRTELKEPAGVMEPVIKIDIEAVGGVVGEEGGWWWGG